MAGAASAHQAATASREQTSHQRAVRTRRSSADPQRAQQGATAAAAVAPAALDSLSRLQQLADASPRVAQLRRLQALADGRFDPVAQLAGGPEEEELIQGQFATAELQPQLQQAPRANNTGLPDQLKSGIESLSGLSMDHVRVHYNSSQPAQLNALAYAQGSDIHLAPGQERHLPHEAWHVVQQAQGRVRPTMQMEGMAINNNQELEVEADLMGKKAFHLKDLCFTQLNSNHTTQNHASALINPTIPAQRVIGDYKQGTLAISTTAKKNLTPEQQQIIQALHNESAYYTLEQARKIAVERTSSNYSASSNASSSSSSSSSSILHSPPFPWRYSPGTQNLMSTMQSDQSGFVASSSPDSKSILSPDMQISIASHDSFSSLTETRKRAVQQSAVMGGISPNVAAEKLGLVCPTNRSWEWLHLVAFSISPTHLGDFISPESVTLMKRYHQPQQIRENLALGTAAANTAMLTYETIIKSIMKAHPTWKLRLWAAAKIDWRIVNDKRIPVSQQINYHFFFIVDPKHTSPPIILTFDTMNHIKPTRLEFSKNVDLFNALLTSPMSVSNAPSKMITPSMTTLSNSKKRKISQSSSSSSSCLGLDNDSKTPASFLEDNSNITLDGTTYLVKDTGGDGHCMYSTALHLNNHSRDEIQSLRNAVAKRLKGRISINHINGVKGQDDGDVNIDLPEVAHILKCNFVVHAIGYNGGELQREQIGSQGPTYHIVHQGNHFMALVRSSDLKTTPNSQTAKMDVL
jgi:hypothetical protein